MLAGAVTNVRPEFGFALLLPIFAAVILGGIGDAFGALAGGIVLGLVIELSTLEIEPPLEDRGRVRGADHRAVRAPAGHLREGDGDMTLPLGVTFDAFTDFGFWTSVGILAGTYALFTLGLQLNVGYTGIVNFGQAGFMAIGAYAMGILVVKADWSFWLALPAAVVIAIGVRPARRAAVAAPARRLLRDRDDRRRRDRAPHRPERCAT